MCVTLVEKNKTKKKTIYLIQSVDQSCKWKKNRKLVRKIRMFLFFIVGLWI